MKNLKKRTGREKTRAVSNMKKHLFCMLAFALIAAMPLTTCKLEPDTGKKSDPRVLLVDVSEETDWDYLVVAKDGSSAFYNVDETTGIPTSLFFKPKKDSDNGTTICLRKTDCRIEWYPTVIFWYTATLEVTNMIWL